MSSPPGYFGGQPPATAEENRVFIYAQEVLSGLMFVILFPSAITYLVKVKNGRKYHERFAAHLNLLQDET